MINLCLVGQSIPVLQWTRVVTWYLDQGPLSASAHLTVARHCMINVCMIRELNIGIGEYKGGARCDVVIPTSEEMTFQQNYSIKSKNPHFNPLRKREP